MENLKTDIRKVKHLLNNNNTAEIKKLSTLFLPTYNAQILAKLDPFEQAQWLKINGYN